MIEVSDIAAVFQEHRDELGFVNTAQCREKTTYTVVRDGAIAGAALCNHCVRKPQTTLYDIAVRDEYRRTGVATDLLDQMIAETPHEKIVAKCPVILPAMQFYNQTGWELQRIEDGKSRSLAVWKYDVDQ